MKMTERLAFLRQRVKDQQAWLAKHGGDRAGYIRHYGDPGIAPCDENGNAKTVSLPAELAEKFGLRPVPQAPGCYYQEMFGCGGTAIYRADKDCLDGLLRELSELEPRFGRYLDEQQKVAATPRGSLLQAAEAMLALVDEHGIGDDDHQSEPVVIALRMAITNARLKQHTPQDDAVAYKGRTCDMTAEDLLSDIEEALHHAIADRSGPSDYEKLRLVRARIRMGRRVLGLATPVLHIDDFDRKWS
jgi:hypothetical protein